MRRCGAKMFEFHIKKDTVTDYLEKLESNFEKNEKTILEEMMYSATGYYGDKTAPIPKRIMLQGKSGKRKYQYNPWLFMSGQDKSRWTIETGKDDFDSVIANYTGMEGYLNADKFKVWVEFSEEFEEYLAEYGDWGTAFNIVRHMNPYDRTLARDYAVYQETGADKHASPDDAEHIGYVNQGMGEAAQTAIPNTLERHFKRLIELK